MMCAEAELEESQWPDGVGMLYLAMSPWEGMWKNRHQLMSRFALTMPVMYVEPWVRLRSLRRQGLARLLSLPQERSPEVVQKAANLYVYKSPRSRPVSGSRYLENVTASRWLKSVRATAEDVGITKPVLWLSLPEMYFAVGQMNELLAVYHVVDEYGGYARQTARKKHRLRDHERKLLASVDLSIVVSPELASEKSRYGDNVQIIENAVDFDAFSQARESRHLPEDMQGIPGPRLGYSGLIGQRLDLELMHQIARQRPDWSIVLVGKVDSTGCADRLAALDELPNVHFLGEKSIREVPDYVASFDLGLLPYVLNLETTNISPLKMYEYFAVDIPVVSTPIPSAVRNKDCLSIAEASADFIKACDNSLASADHAISQLRIATARENTWDRRIDQTTELLQETLRNKGTSTQ